MREAVNLYRHFNADGRLLYVGISIDPARRQRDHVTGAAWRDEISDIKITKYRSRELALSAERRAIKTENPLFNVHHTNEPIIRKQLVLIEGLPPVINTIKREAHRLNLTAERLANLADVSVSNVYGILRGDVNPTLEIIEKLARAMKLKLVAQ